MSVTKAQLIGNVSGGAVFSGNVGIGTTTSPTTALDVNGTVKGTLFEVAANSYWGLSESADPIINFDANDFIRYAKVDNVFQFVSGGSERLRITAAGDVGIGNNDPSYALDIASADTTAGIGYALRLRQNATAGAAAIQFTDNPVTTQYGYIASDSSSNLKFATGLTEKARIDSSGRILVGTSSARLADGGASTPAIQYQGSDPSFMATRAAADAAPSHIVLGKTRGSAYEVVSNGDSIGLLSFQAADGTNLIRGAEIRAQVDGAVGINSMPGRIIFNTTAAGTSSAAERMRIRSDGNFGIGSAGFPTVRVFVAGSDATINNWACYGVNSAGTQLFGARNDGAFNTGVAALSPYFLTTGVAANVVVDAGGFIYRSTSSARFKTDIETLEDSYADALLDVRPVWYRSIAPGDTTHPDWGYWGFIAEEVAEIDPRLVFWKTHETQKDEDNNDIQVELEEPLAEGVQYDRFVPHLLNLIKRQSEQIEALTARVTALES